MNFRSKLRVLAWILIRALQIVAEVIGYWFCIVLIYFIVEEPRQLETLVNIVAVLEAFVFFIGFRFLRYWLE